MQRRFRALVTSVALAGTACGSTPTSPAGSTNSNSQTSVQPLSGSASLSGVVVGLQDQRPVAGATVTLATGVLNGVQGSGQAVTTSDGSYTFPSAPIQALQLSIAASGYLTRQTWLQLTGVRHGIGFNLIANAAPFSLGFYQQFARNAYDAPKSLEALHPWTMAPSFHINTRLPSGDDVPAAMLQGIERVITNSVPELTAGHFQVAAIEIGAAARPGQIGWVNVAFVAPGTLGTNVLGNAQVGGTASVINLVYDPALEARYQTDFILHCEGAVVEVADHEIVHTMGYYHTDDLAHDFQSGPGCPGTGRSARATYHAAIVYSRLPGNVDPDTDTTLAYTFSLERARQMIISCMFPRRIP